MLGSNATFARRLLRWYDRSRRDLPWRAHHSTGRTPEPYHVLVSEAMLQQTQVATVVPYFNRFVARFRSLQELAGADEQEVLRLWQGLGYYSRARNLRAAARKVVSEFGGRLPDEVGQLLTLPGVGRYTAGAVASIAFGRRAPILDGNVLRVLCRLDRIETDPRDRPTQALLWARAEQILPAARAGDFNSALMELGATVCAPRSPRCLLCPVREHCQARAAGVQEVIPAPRKVKATPLYFRHVFCIRLHDRWLIEQRPPKGRWAGLWQFITMDAGAGGGAAPGLGGLPVPVGRAAKIGEVTHGLTHRRYQFTVFVCDAVGGVPEGVKGPLAARAAGHGGDPAAPDRAWATLQGIGDYPLPRPHLRIAEMLGSLPAGGRTDKNG